MSMDSKTTSVPVQFELIYIQGHLSLLTYYHYFVPGRLKIHTKVSSVRLSDLKSTDETDQFVQQTKLWVLNGQKVSVGTRRWLPSGEIPYPGYCRSPGSNVCLPALCNCDTLFTIWQTVKTLQSNLPQGPRDHNLRIEPNLSSVKTGKIKGQFSLAAYVVYFAPSTYKLVNMTLILPYESNRNFQANPTYSISAYDPAKYQEIPVPELASRRYYYPSFCKEPGADHCSRALCNCNKFHRYHIQLKAIDEKIRQLDKDIAKDDAAIADADKKLWENL